MKDKSERIEVMGEYERDASPSAIELWKLMRGRSHRVSAKEGRRPDSMLAVYGDRVTYTFILDNEVASIHFDRMRREIFFKGHNIHNMELTEEQREALLHMEGVLASEEEGKPLLSDYSATLAKVLADK